LPAFSISNVNMFALPIPGVATYVWDDLQFTLDVTQRVGYGIGPANIGADLNVYANAGIRVTLQTDFGSANIGYTLASPVFTGTTNPNSVPVPPTDGLPFYLNSNAHLDTSTMVRTGSYFTTTAPNIHANMLDVDFFYNVKLSMLNIGIEVDLWLDSWDLSLGGTTILDTSDTINLIHIGAGNPSWDVNAGAVTGSVHLPGPSNFGAQQVGTGARPSISLEGDDPSNFAQISLDITQKLAELTGISTSYTFEPVSGTTIQATLLQAVAVAGLRSSQLLTFTPETVKVDLYVPITGQRLSGVLGESFDIETPQSGQGVEEVQATYTLFGTYTSEAGVKLNGRIDLAALSASINNTNFYDFSVGFGPLLTYSIPDSTGWQTPRLPLYDKSLSLSFAPQTESLYFRYERFASASDGDDIVFLTDNQDTVLGKDGDPDGHLFGGNDILIGNTLANKVNGDAGNDYMYGGGGNDTLYGDAGNDTIEGADGIDFLTGGSGNDDILGGDGNDALFAGTGQDSLSGGAGDDELFSLATDQADAILGGSGNDVLLLSRTGSSLDFDVDFRNAAVIGVTLADGTTISGVEVVTFFSGFGNDSITGSDGDDLLRGGWGNDTIRGADGHDRLFGESGDDLIRLLVTDYDDDIDGGSGVDTLEVFTIAGLGTIGANFSLLHPGVLGNLLPNGNSFTSIECIRFTSYSLTQEDSVTGGVLNDYFSTGAGDDLIDGGPGYDTILAGTGDDTIFSEDRDSIDGGDGLDTVVIDRSGARLPTGISLDFNRTDAVTGAIRLSDGTELFRVEQLFFDGGDHTDVITGGAQRDQIFGNGGNDLLRGSRGADLVMGGDGDDTIVQTAADGDGSHPGVIDLLDGGAGNDLLMLDALGFTSGITLSFDPASNANNGTLPDATVLRGFERVNLKGSRYGDNILGGDVDVEVVQRVFLPILPGIGGAGGGGGGFFDIVTGRLANTIRGLGGDDVLTGGIKHDEIYGGGGDDRITLTKGADLLDGGEETPTGPLDANNVRSRLPRDDQDQDVLVVDSTMFDVGNAWDFTHLTDQDPDDQNLRGTTLADGTRALNFEAVEFIGGMNGSIVTGSAGDDLLRGMTNSNLFDSGAGNDQLFGGNGNDTLRGGDGNDTIEGGGGSDLMEGGDGADRLVNLGFGGAVAAPYSTLRGGAGNDILSSNIGAELDGGQGTDMAELNLRFSFGSGITQDFRGMGGNLLMANGIRLTSIEHLNFTGNGFVDAIIVGSGVHKLDGGFGPDDSLTIDLTGEVRASGAHFVIEANFDSVTPVLVFDNGTEVRAFERITILASPGGFTLDRTAPARIALPDVTVDWGDAPHRETGGRGDDALLGGVFGDLLRGGEGNDTLSGAGGNDSLDGGPGDDTAVFLAGRAPPRYGIRDGHMIVLGIDGRVDLADIEEVRFGEAPGLRVDSLRGGPSDQGLVYGRIGGLDGYVLPDRYDGPVEGLVNQLLGSSEGDIVLGTDLADFFNALSGDDAVDGGGGNDVVDGGLGSNFLIGGRGSDIFFIDGRGAAAFNTWSTITDWEAGETLTIFGYRPGLSQLLWVERDGTAGYQGATLHADLDGNGLIDSSVTWAGVTQTQLPTPLFGTDYIYFGGGA